MKKIKYVTTLISNYHSYNYISGHLSMYTNENKRKGNEKDWDRGGGALNFPRYFSRCEIKKIYINFGRGRKYSKTIIF